MRAQPSSASPDEGTLRERKKRATRDRIRQRAVELFLRRGFDAVSIAEIADAADVSKMTVFNYFPAKEDLLLEGNIRLFPDVAGVVRARGGTPPVRAIRDFVVRELDGRAEWTGLHDGVAQFVRVFAESPTLMGAVNRRWQALREGLVAALAETAGHPHDPLDGVYVGELVQSADRARELTAETLRPRMIAGQVMAIMQTLTMANQYRQVAGLTADETAAQARAEALAAFELVEEGVGDWPGPVPGPPRPAARRRS